MGRTLPTECEHGNVVDWGDFGPDDRDEPTCDECEKRWADSVIVPGALLRELRDATWDSTVGSRFDKAVQALIKLAPEDFRA